MKLVANNLCSHSAINYAQIKDTDKESQLSPA